MSEPLDKLKATIRELERELGTLATIDTETRGLLQEAMTEIQAAIQTRDTTELDSHSLSGRLSEAAEHFETTHPALFGIVSRIADVLGQMGI